MLSIDSLAGMQRQVGAREGWFSAIWVYIYIVITNNPTGGHFFVTHSLTDTPSLYIYRHHQQSNWWSLFRYSLTDRHSVIIYISSSPTIQLVVTFSLLTD